MQNLADTASCGRIRWPVPVDNCTICTNVRLISHRRLDSCLSEHDERGAQAVYAIVDGDHVCKLLWTALLVDLNRRGLQAPLFAANDGPAILTRVLAFHDRSSVRLMSQIKTGQIFSTHSTLTCHRRRGQRVCRQFCTTSNAPLTNAAALLVHCRPTNTQLTTHIARVWHQL